MRSYAPYPTSSKGTQQSRNITSTRISPKKNSGRLLSQRKRDAILEIHPAPFCVLALLRSRRECPVNLDDGVVFVLDLRARLFDFLHRVVIWSEETVPRVVACQISSQAESKVATAVRYERTEGGRPFLDFGPCFIDILRCLDVSKISRKVLYARVGSNVSC
jgi:hypothetical protein